MASRIYKAIGWKPWTLRSNYNRKGECVKCPVCGSKNFREDATSMLEYTVCESYTYCKKCGEQVNFWAYGSYDPCYKFADRSFEMCLQRVQCKLRRISMP